MSQSPFAEPATAPIKATLVPEAAPPAPAAPEPAPVRRTELLGVFLLVVLADLTLYRGQGFSGLAVLFVAAPVLLWLGSPRPQLGGSFWVVFAMLLLLAARLVWLGSALGAALGFALLVASAMALAGRRIYVLDLLAYAVQSGAAGCAGLARYRRSAARLRPTLPRFHPLRVLLPLAALALFGTLFLLANPDLLATFQETMDWMFRWLADWVADLAPSWMEVLFWAAAAIVVVGLLRPILKRPLLDRFSDDGAPSENRARPAADAPLYPALRNTLAALIALFLAYLVFEFKTLWFREFPKGFYYAGYAHEGAAWLTASLALATVVLSLIFRGRVLADPRLPRLRRLAWVWSAQNLVLAVTVYHRLCIYIGFNGMTRMRTVALFGVTAVVAGVVLVVWKIARSRDFVWLLRRHLAALAIVVYAFALTPVDAIVHRYNVGRVLAGDLPPAVQISVHPIDAEGVMALRPLVHSDDPILREGLRAMLAKRALEAERAAARRERLGWTAFQCAEDVLLRRLYEVRGDWADYLDASKRSTALARFHQYVYQWY
jgi:hypothetical protein